MSVDEVVAAVERHGCPLVEITGGEPLLQDDVYPLMDRLLAAGRTVMLETGGHRPIDARAARAVLKIVDVKCPAAARPTRTTGTNLDRLAPHDEVKFVIKDRADYEFAATSIARHDLPSRARRSCCRRSTACSIRKTLSEWMLADRLPGAPAAAAAQVHLVADTRGV